VFLLGSIWFHKTAFVRTVLWLVIFAVGLGIVALVTARIAIPSLALGHGGVSLDMSSDAFQQVLRTERVTKTLEAARTVACVLVYASAPACWLAGYFRLAEAEV
jgi:hypothetical protein